MRKFSGNVISSSMYYSSKTGYWAWTWEIPNNTKPPIIIYSSPFFVGMKNFWVYWISVHWRSMFSPKDRNKSDPPQWIECLKLFLTFNDVRNICYIALRIAWETTFIYDFCLVPIYGFPPSHNSPIPIPNLHFSHFSASAGKHQGESSICLGLSTPASFDVHVDRALL